MLEPRELCVRQVDGSRGRVYYSESDGHWTEIARRTSGRVAEEQTEGVQRSSGPVMATRGRTGCKPWSIAGNFMAHVMRRSFEGG